MEGQLDLDELLKQLNSQRQLVQQLESRNRNLEQMLAQNNAERESQQLDMVKLCSQIESL